MSSAPLRSMTGYGAARGEADGLALRMRLRSVNHRFLDLQLRLPPELEGVQPLLEKGLKAAIHRGHVELTAAFDRAPAAKVAVNRELALAYVEAFRDLSKSCRELRHGEIDAIEILRLPGVVSMGRDEAWESAANGEASPLGALARSVLQACLADHTHMREHEGEALAAELRARLGTIAAAVKAIGDLRQQLDQALYSRLRARLAQLMAEPLPAERLAQEAALLAERSDVSEELQRLEAHLAQFHRLLDEGGEVGKKLDFLLQELNREVTTLLAKTSGVAAEGLAITDHGLTIKAEVEKIREQIQNLE